MSDAESVKSSELARLESLLAKDGMLLFLATASAYLFCFKSQQAYLKYFGLSSEFVQIDVAQIVVFGAAAVGVLLLFWFSTWMLPITFLQFLRKVFLSVLPFLLPSALGLLIYANSGMCWSVVIVFALSAIVIVMQAFELVTFLREGRGLSNWFSYQEHATLRWQSLTVQQHFFESVGKNGRLLCISMLLIPFLVGPIVGAGLALNKETFVSYQIDGVDFLVVSEFRSGFVAVGAVPENGETGKLRLNGVINWSPFEKMENLALSNKLVNDGLVVNLPAAERTSLKEFCNKQGFRFCS